MKVLVVGGGGREHAIIWKLRQSGQVDKIYCAPGNGGISKLAECVNIQALEFDKLVAFAKDNSVDYTIIGPDDPLVMGIADEFQRQGLAVFGPCKAAARIEGSKSYSKYLMKKYDIPTAAYEVFDNYEQAITYIRTQKLPVVIKADGLALGKGVLICNTSEEAESALKQIMIDKKFGTSGEKVVIEEFLSGHEVSVLAFCDGKTLCPMVSAQDHKRAFDNDMGLNTGGMGTFSPSRHYSDEIAKLCNELIFQKTIDALNKEGIVFIGIIFFGLMLTENGPKVIEYNARFGDPETQVILPRLENDLMEIIIACIEGKLNDIIITWKESAAVCVVAASGGYPESYAKGYEITGLERFDEQDGIHIFHSGTKIDKGKYYTNGGRVLGVTALSETLDGAIAGSYEALGQISFKDMHFRKDIGIK